MAVIDPTKINGMSLDDVIQTAKDVSSGGSSIAATGSYGEGGVYGTRDLLSKLKSAVTSGKLSVVDYQQIATPLTQNISQGINSLVAQGKGAIGTQISEDLRSKGFLKADPSGKNVFSMPFTAAETAKLPVNVLPTQKDVDSGLASRDILPIQRLQDPSGGGVDAQGNPIPSDINLSSDRGQVELEAQRQADELQKTLDQQKTLRDTNRTALANQLALYQDDQFKRAVPDLTENANTSGILRSTGFGDILASKYANLTKDSENQLAMQGLTDSEKYAEGLGDVTNTRLGLQTGGLQRQFSLNDTASTTALAQQLAQLAQPSKSSGKSSTTNAAIQGGSTLIGATLGGPIGGAIANGVSGTATTR